MMQYEPIKKSLGHVFSGSVILRKAFYSLIDLLLLRTWHVKKALRRICPHLPQNAAILDAGSGMGQYSWRLSRMVPDSAITGVDINEKEVAESNQFVQKAGLANRIKFIQGDLVRYCEPEKYNLIISVDVMEHINDDQQVFRNFFSSIVKDGVLLISTPSDKGGSDAHDENDESFIGEHVRNGYGKEEITSKLSSAGFTDISVLYTYGWPGRISWKISMKYPVKMLNSTKLLFIILPFYYMIVLPFALVLNLLDIAIKHKSGTGLLVQAGKR
jgi:SAM-dependent methyltransferase